MRIATALITAGVLAAALAGCLGTAGEDGDPGGTSPEVRRGAQLPTHLDMFGCLETYLVLYTDPTEADRLLPPGLEPRLDATGDAQVAFFHWTCRAAVDGTAVGEVEEVWAYVYIEPPETVANPEANHHAYHLGILTDTEATEVAYRAWGIPRVHLGTGSAETPEPGSGGLFTMAADAPGLILEAEGALAPASLDVSGAAYRFLMAEEDGTLTGVLDIGIGPHTFRNAGQAAIEMTVDGESVEGRPYPGFAAVAGGEDWDLRLSYQPLDALDAS